jgi:hypothetical protein
MQDMRRFLLILLLTAPLHAQSAEHRTPPPEGVPSFIMSGINAYKSVGPEAAVKAWTQDGALENSKEAADQASYMHQVQDLYGPFQGFEFITAQVLTARTRVIYLAFEYEKGPLFAKFVIYRAGQRWLLTGLDLNMREEMILPAGTSQIPAKD